MKDNFSNIGQAFKHAGQAPLDGKYLIEDVEELHVTAPNESRAYTFYEGYVCYVAPLKGFYMWTDDNVESEEAGYHIPESIFTYPDNVSYGDVDYSLRRFMFVRLNINFGENSNANNINIGNLISLYINLSPEKGNDILNPSDTDLHQNLVTLLDYIRFYFKRNNLLHFVDNLFAFTDSESTRKELDDKYRSNSMYYVLGNHIMVDDLDDPKKITLQSKKSQGGPTEITEQSHNGFMHLIAREIYNIINQDGIGFIDIQSHDGHFVSLRFDGSSELFVKGEPFSSLGPESFSFANFISVTGTLDSKYGTLVNKPTKVRVRSVFGKDNTLNVPGTQIPIKETVIAFTRKEVEDNGFVLSHNLNVDRYISEVFSYPQSIYTEKVPVTLNPRELQEARIISAYGPNDSNTIYLENMIDYRGEDEDETIYYLVKYIEKTDYELSMPSELIKICELDNDPGETVTSHKILRGELSAGFYSPYDGAGDFTINNINIISVEAIDPNYPNETIYFEGSSISPLQVIPYSSIDQEGDNLRVEVQASGGNREVTKFTYQIEDFQGRLSNPVTFRVVKQGTRGNENNPPVINPIPIINSSGDILAYWSDMVRIKNYGPYYMQAIVYDADKDVNDPGELEVNLNVSIRKGDGTLETVKEETFLGIKTEQVVMTSFNFLENPGSQNKNVTYLYVFRYTVTDPKGATTTTERKITIIY